MGDREIISELSEVGPGAGAFRWRVLRRRGWLSCFGDMTRSGDREQVSTAGYEKMSPLISAEDLSFRVVRVQDTHYIVSTRRYIEWLRMERVFQAHQKSGEAKDGFPVE